MFIIRWVENEKNKEDTAFTLVGISIIVDELVKKSRDGIFVSDIDIEMIDG